MAILVIMPKQGQSVETCIITKWFKQKGDPVKTGDILFSYETDKAAFDVESPGDGTLLEVFYQDGSEVPVLENVAVIGNPGEPVESLLAAGSEKVEKQETGNKPAEYEKTSQSLIMESEQVLRRDNLKIRISPRAKRLAEEKGINVSNIAGTGPVGRVIYSDIERIVSGKTPQAGAVQKSAAEFADQPVSNVRKLIAGAMYASLQNSAQLTHHMSADVRYLLEARRKIKDEILKGITNQDITLNDMICFCVIKALGKYPEVNSHFLGDHIRIFNTIHLAIAVDTPRGLMVPTVKNAGEMDLVTLSRELRSVAEACKKGNINPELIRSTAATFTVSNLGNYGVEIFTPVINLPQTAILGVCTIINRPADMGNNIFGFVPFIGLSLTYDHRSIDGGPATLFLREIREQIENFRYQI
jgi:pyruvate dehydrogenase E2 component (dihydrolipoyllysine-residue acetyltransferase)